MKKSKWHEIAADSFRGFAIPSIQSINLQDVNTVADDLIDVFSETCPCTRNVDLSRSRITDGGVSALAQGCPLLTSINLSGSRNITDAGILALAQGCSALKVINLSRCSNIRRLILNDLRSEYSYIRFTS